MCFMMLLAVDWLSILSMALIGFVLVVVMLLFLVGLMKLFGYAFTVKKKKQPVDKAELRDEEIAAIATALSLFRGTLHDKESEVVTILKIKRAYSPWNSKIHGLTKMPEHRR